MNRIILSLTIASLLLGAAYPIHAMFGGGMDLVFRMEADERQRTNALYQARVTEYNQLMTQTITLGAFTYHIAPQTPLVVGMITYAVALQQQITIPIAITIEGHPDFQSISQITFPAPFTYEPYLAVDGDFLSHPRHGIDTTITTSVNQAVQQANQIFLQGNGDDVDVEELFGDVKNANTKS